MRRSDPSTLLAEARDVAERTHVLWWEYQVAAAEAEALGLEGVPKRSRDATAEVFESAKQLGAPWPIAELGAVAPPGRHRGADPSGRRRPLRTAAPRRLELRRRGMADRRLPLRGGGRPCGARR